MLHILRPPATTTGEEKEQLSSLDKYQRRNTNYQALRRDGRAEIWYFDNNSGRDC